MNYKEIYLRHYNKTKEAYISCEVCGATANDIHHVHRRGAGGNRQPDTIYNLIALCRQCHLKYGDKREFKEWLWNVHNKTISGAPEFKHDDHRSRRPLLDRKNKPDLDDSPK